MNDFIETTKGTIKVSAIAAVRPLPESDTTKERVVIDYAFGDRANSVIIEFDSRAERDYFYDDVMITIKGQK